MKLLKTMGVSLFLFVAASFTISASYADGYWYPPSGGYRDVVYSGSGFVSESFSSSYSSGGYGCCGGSNDIVGYMPVQNYKYVPIAPSVPILPNVRPISTPFNFGNINSFNNIGGGGLSTSGLSGLALPLLGILALSGEFGTKQKKKVIVHYYPSHAVSESEPSRVIVRTRYVETKRRYVPSSTRKRCRYKRVQEVCDIKFGRCSGQRRYKRVRSCDYDDDYRDDVSYNYEPTSTRNNFQNDNVEIIGGMDEGDMNEIATVTSYDDGEETYVVNY